MSSAIKGLWREVLSLEDEGREVVTEALALGTQEDQKKRGGSLCDTVGVTQKQSLSCLGGAVFQGNRRTGLTSAIEKAVGREGM